MKKFFPLTFLALSAFFIYSQELLAQSENPPAVVQEDKAAAPEASSVPESAPSLSGSLKDSTSSTDSAPSKSMTLDPTQDLAPKSDDLSTKEPEKIVKKIDLKGSKTVSSPTVLSKIKTRVGEPYYSNVISDDIKRLRNTGYFDDVSVDREEYEGGFKVIFYLVEKPIIDKITFTKTRYFSSRTLQVKLKSKEGKFLDNKTIKEDIDILKDMYVKKGLTSTDVDVETDLDKTTNKAKLHFIVTEGERAKIKQIVVNGNKAFSDKRIIKLIKTRTAWLFNAGTLQDDVLAEDMERIKSFYGTEGFIDATADYKIEEGKKGRITILIDISEGRRYYTGAIDIVNNSILSREEILSAMKDIKTSKVFSPEKLSGDIALIQALYFDKGYIFANAKESTSVNPDNGQVDIKLDISEGELAYVNKVRIQGNTRTRDIVIRREMRIKPGEKFDGEKLKRSKERLRNLGYFEDIGYDIEDTDQSNQKDLVVQVKEAKTGNLSFGGGYSTVDKIVGFVEMEQKNFDFTNWPTFTGGGQDLTIHAEAGSVRNNQRISFTEPWIFDYPISGGFDLYRSMRSREQDVGYGYDERRLGGDLRFGKSITEYVSAGTSYRLENIKISNLEDGASSDLASEVGKNTISSVSFRLTRDSRDSAINPTKGLLVSGTTEVAGGLLGGDKDFTKFEGKASYDVPMPYSSVLEFRMRAGLADAFGDSSKVPIFERYFAGGAYTIRGYNERKVGPLDPVTDDPIGGESMLVGNVEFTVPLVDFIKFATFLDTGNVWSKLSDFGNGGYKSGSGIGFRLKTPIGPINLDYGYPLNDEPGEEKKSGKFYFSVSRGF